MSDRPATDRVLAVFASKWFTVAGNLLIVYTLIREAIHLIKGDSVTTLGILLMAVGIGLVGVQPLSARLRRITALRRIRRELRASRDRLASMVERGEFDRNNLPRKKWNDYEDLLASLRDRELRNAIDSAYSEVVRINQIKGTRWEVERDNRIRQEDRVADAQEAVEKAFELLDARLGD